MLLLASLALTPALSQGSQGAAFAWIETQEPELSIEDIRALPESQWRQKAADETLNFGFSDSSFWLRVDVPENSFNRLLEVGYPLLDDVRVYWFVGGELVEHHVTGDHRHFGSRPIHHLWFSSGCGRTCRF